MTAYFFDSSALVKRYVTESGSAWVRQCFTTPPSHTVFVAELTLVEVASAISRRWRDGSLTKQQWGHCRMLFLSDLGDYDIVSLDRSVARMAMELCYSYNLRASDAIQLATALLLQGRLRFNELPLLTFVGSDQDLLTAAAKPAFEFHPVDPTALTL